MNRLLSLLLCLLTGCYASFAEDVKMHIPVNGTFDDLYGWTNENMSYQGDAYTNGDSKIDHFAQSWHRASYGGRSRSLVYQTYFLAKGRYRLECDAIATFQDDAALSIYDVSLFAIVGQDTIKTSVQTMNNAPEHFNVEFEADGISPVTMGFGTFVSTNANWLAVDNIALTMLNANATPLYDAFVASSGIKVTTLNDEAFPWFNYGGNYIYPSNTAKKSTSRLTFEVDSKEPFTFSMDYSMPDDGYSGSTSNRAGFTIDGVSEFNRTLGWDSGFEGTAWYVLPAGTHEITIEHYYENHLYGFYIKDVTFTGHASQITEVTLGQAGDLGVELLSVFDKLTDVEYLKISGPMNSDDWAQIANLTNVVYLDMTDAVTTEMPASAMTKNSRLVEYKCPRTLKTIGSRAFYQRPVRSVELNEGLETIGDRAFYESGISSLIIPSTVTSVGEYMCNNCDRLKSVVLGSALKTLPQYCFYDCNTLETVSGGENVSLVNQYCFCSDQRLKSAADLQPVTINNYAFAHCNALESIDLSRTQTVGRYTFRDCQALTSVNMPAIASIDYYAFGGCSKLETVAIGPSLPQFGSVAFSDCPVTAIYLSQPSAPNRSSSSDNLFYFNGNLFSSATLYVPEYAMTSYKMHEYWSQFKNYEVNPIKVENITISGQLTLTSNARIPDVPNLTLAYNGNSNASLTVNGTAEQPLGNYVQYNRWADNGNSCLISRCSQLTSTSSEVRYYMDYNYYNNWYYLCLPFDVRVADITTDTDAAVSVCRYDGANRAEQGAGQSWVRLTDADIIRAGQGYIYCVSKNATVSFPATAATHNQIFTSTAVSTPLDENVSEVANDGGWNLVGNSYPAYYDIYYMDYTAPITTWHTTNRTFTAYSPADDRLALLPFEAFFVQKPMGVDQLVLNPQGRQISRTVESRQAAPAKAGSKAGRQLIDLTLTDGSVTDRTRIVINAAASDNFEATCDASKMMSYEAPQLYSQRGDELFAINEGPQASGAVALSLWLPTAGEYTLDVSRQDCEFTLYDNGVEVQLPYTFSAAEGTVEGRFVLCLGGVLTAIASAATQPAAPLTIFDLQGRVCREPQSNGRADLNGKGVYIINNKKVVK